MRVTLLECTPNALPLLVFTKNTRLSMAGAEYKDVLNWPEDRLMQEWEYMKGTIQSSWEFVDYVLCIEVVTRAFTHQLVRHRVGTSFAQQAQRAVPMEGFEYITPPRINSEEELLNLYQNAMRAINDYYSELVKDGANRQDARGVLPTNIATNIVFKANLRTLHDMARKRLCVKAQGEFQDVFRAIREEVRSAHPWAAEVLQPECGWNGTCIFPSYPTKDCPVKPYVYNPVTGYAYGMSEPNMDVRLPYPLVQIRAIHARERAEAQPVVKS